MFKKAYTQKDHWCEGLALAHHATLKTTNVKRQTVRKVDKIPGEATPEELSNVTARMEGTDNRKSQLKHCTRGEM